MHNKNLPSSCGTPVLLSDIESVYVYHLLLVVPSALSMSEMPNDRPTDGVTSEPTVIINTSSKRALGEATR